LNSELNKNATITNADLRVHYFERWAAWNGAGVDTSSNTPRIQLRKAQVTLTDAGVRMIADVDVFEPLATVWIENSSKEERIQDCKRLGNKAANQLAEFLECDPSLITISIESLTGELSIPAFQAEKIAEQAASSNH
jgi:hypothetical protein